MALKMLEVTWCDAWSNDSAWEGSNLANLCAESAINKTIGYEVKRTRKQLVLASSTFRWGERFSTLTGIPLGCILRIRKLK